MTGEYLAELMSNNELKGILAKHARRYSKRVENQEEYIQDAWIRIAKKQDGQTIEYYGEQGRKAIYASYMRHRYHTSVYKKEAQNLNGISRKPMKIPRDAIALGRGRYLCRKHANIDSWYYTPEWEDYVKVWDVGAHMYRWYPKNQCPFPSEEQEPATKEDSQVWKDHVILVDPNWKPPVKCIQDKKADTKLSGGRSMFDRDMDVYEQNKFRWLNHLSVRPECG